MIERSRKFDPQRFSHKGPLSENYFHFKTPNPKRNGLPGLPLSVKEFGCLKGIRENSQIILKDPGEAPPHCENQLDRRLEIGLSINRALAL
jgi:hypothetical protein